MYNLVIGVVAGATISVTQDAKTGPIGPVVHFAIDSRGHWRPSRQSRGKDTPT